MGQDTKAQTDAISRCGLIRVWQASWETEDRRSL